MNEVKTKRILKAIRCCRDDLCAKCPLQLEICDKLRVESESIPVELLDMIEDVMEEYLKENQAEREKAKQKMEKMKVRFENGKPVW